MVVAAKKSLRAYRRICRMLPYILRVQELSHKVSVSEAKKNLASHFKANAHLRDPKVTDFYTNAALMIMHDAEWKLSCAEHFDNYVLKDVRILGF